MVRYASFICHPMEYKKFDSELVSQSPYARVVVCHPLNVDSIWTETKRITSKSIGLSWQQLRSKVVKALLVPHLRFRAWRKCHYHQGVRYILTLQGTMVVGSRVVAMQVVDFALCDHYLYLLFRGGIQRYRCGAMWDVAYLDYRPNAPLRAFSVQSSWTKEHIFQVYW